MSKACITQAGAPREIYSDMQCMADMCASASFDVHPRA
jgi:hypothetical protein